ncbi:MAG: hypothetical protein H5U06_02265 [Candidatus Aminicenantes bacterium]|nr:hypothetical protein [Candidatus Aminicenantes bacterium]
MTKNFRIGIWILLTCLLIFPSARADWKSQINQYLKQHEYAEAQNLLKINLSKLENSDKQEALALLPYLYHRNNLPAEEKKAVIDYFEEYGQAQPLFEFLDFSVFNDVLEFWGKWREEYPLISNLNFLVPVSAQDRTIPEILRLGFDLSTEAYYKIHLEGQPLEGGLWSKGPHLVQLPLPFSFDQPFSLNLDIFMKTKSITIKKRVVLEFRVETKNLQNPDLLVQRQDAPPVKNIEGEVALYIGETLIYKATKYLQKQIPVKITIPPPNPPGTKPYLVPQKDQYPMHSVSIFDAITAITKIIQDWKKKPPEKTPATFNRKAEINFTFTHPERQEIRTDVTIRLKPQKAEVQAY